MDEDEDEDETRTRRKTEEEDEEEDEISRDLDESVGLDEDESFEGEEQAELELVSREVLQRNTAGWTFCLTDNGLYMMALTGATAIGDLCVVLDGGKVPVILRPVKKENPSERQKYEIMHVAYVHGFMDGEAESWVNEGRLMESDFLIV